MMYMILNTIHSIPLYLETFMVKNMTKAAVITISPVWLRNAPLMGGLDGYRYNDSFSHMKDVIINAKNTLRELVGITNASQYSPLKLNTGIPTSMEQSLNEAINQADEVQKSLRTSGYTGQTPPAGVEPAKSKPVQMKRLKELSRVSAQEAVDRYGATFKKAAAVAYATHRKEFADAGITEKEFVAYYGEELTEAANNYRKTGMHCTHEEVKIWLKDLANGKTGRVPKCHK
jgi:hypothetical protein